MKTRNPDHACWRLAAIYRCCIRFGMDSAWALRQVRGVSPDGGRDHMVANWFTDMDRIRELHQRRMPVEESCLAMAA